MKKQTVVFIPDTNILWTKETGPLVFSPEFVRRIKEVDGHHTIKVRIPQVVFQEFVNQRKRALRNQLEKIKEAADVLNVMTGHAHQIPDEASLTSQIEATFEKQIKEFGYEVIPTPIAEIPWQEIISGAVNRSPPFEFRSEKGFRDAVIMHTVLHYARGHKEPTYFIANDKLLREATLAKQASIGVFEGLDDSLGALRLIEGTLNKDIALSIQADAGTVFASSESRSGFLYDKGVLTKILHELHDKFYEASDDAAKYRRKGDEQLIKASTSFMELVSKDVYQWKTQLEFTVEFVSTVGTNGIRKTIRISVVWNARYTEGKFSEFEFKSLAPEGENSTLIASAMVSGTVEQLAATKLFTGGISSAISGAYVNVAVDSTAQLAALSAPWPDIAGRLYTYVNGSAITDQLTALTDYNKMLASTISGSDITFGYSKNISDMMNTPVITGGITEIINASGGKIVNTIESLNPKIIFPSSSLDTDAKK